MSSRYIMSETEHEFANKLEGGVTEQDTLEGVVWSAQEVTGYLLDMMTKREHDLEWIINDQSTRRMYDLVLKSVERMKKVAEDAGLQPWDGVVA